MMEKCPLTSLYETARCFVDVQSGCAASVCAVCVCVLLTQCGVVEGEVSQVPRVLWQGEQPPGVTVPHQAAPGAVLQHAVLDDLHMEAGSTHTSDHKPPTEWFIDVEV